MSSPGDRWATSDAYEDFMGRWSRVLAPDFIRWLGADPALNWLDVGCGTGALTSAISEHADPSSVVACDPSDAFIQGLRRRMTDERVTTVVARSGDLPERPGGFDRVVSGLVLNFLPDQRGAVQEMRARACSGGTVAAYVWDYADRMQFLRVFWDEAVALDESARDLDEGIRFPMCQPDALESIFSDAGLRDVASGAIEISTHFDSFNDYWRPFLGGTGPAPSYASSLSEPQRSELQRRLEQRLAPTGTDVVIGLAARAWVVRGTAA